MNIKNISKLNQDFFYIKNCRFSVYVSSHESMFDYLFYSGFNYEKNYNKFYLTEKKGSLINSIKDGLYISLYFELDLLLKNTNKEQLVSNNKLLKTLFFQLQESIGLNPNEGKIVSLFVPTVEYRYSNEEKNININLSYYESKNYFSFNVQKRVKIKKFL